MSPAFTGPPAVAAAPNGLIYTPPANFNGADQPHHHHQRQRLQRQRSGQQRHRHDRGRTSDVKVINVADVNDAPTVSGDGTQAAPTILEDTPFTSAARADAWPALFDGQLLPTRSTTRSAAATRPARSATRSPASPSSPTAAPNANGAVAILERHDLGEYRRRPRRRGQDLHRGDPIRFNPALNLTALRRR